MGQWEGLAVASLDPKVWQLATAMCDQIDDTEVQMVSLAFLIEEFKAKTLQIDEYKAAMLRIGQLGCTVKYPVDILDLSELNIDGKDAILMPIACMSMYGIATWWR